jgi:hypothetical protein
MAKKAMTVVEANNKLLEFAWDYNHVGYHYACDMLTRLAAGKRYWHALRATAARSEVTPSAVFLAVEECHNKAYLRNAEMCQAILDDTKGDSPAPDEFLRAVAAEWREQHMKSYQEPLA